MNQQEKWVELFKQVVGRVPSPQEFVAGKESGFDFKQIKAIAGLQAEEAPSSVAKVAPQKPETIVENAEAEIAKDPIVSEERQEFSQVNQTVAQTVPLNPTANLSTNSLNVVPVQPAQNPVNQRKKKKTIILGLLGIGVVAGLAAGYFYMDQKTGSDVAALELLDMINKEDYSGLAENFSSGKGKWKQADAKEFLAYLDEQPTDVAAVLEKLANDPSYIYSDDRGNKLMGMKKKSDFLGLFPSYQVVSYPIEVFAKTNTDGLTLNKKQLAKGEEISLGSYPFTSQTFHLTGKTAFGSVDSDIVTKISNSENNQIHLSLESTQKLVRAQLPEIIVVSGQKKLFINGKEVATALEKSVEVLENQNLSVYAEFVYEGTTYKTEETKVVVGSGTDTIVAKLKLSDEVAEKIEKAKKAKAEKEAAAKKEKETEANIKNFMNSYINAMRNSIRYRDNQFAQYYDTSSSAYQTMDDYVSNGGVAKANVDYQTTLDYTVTSINKEGNDYVVTVHNKFREVYMNGKSDIVEKNQVFKLRPNGSSFLIYSISEY